MKNGISKVLHLLFKNSTNVYLDQFVVQPEAMKKSGMWNAKIKSFATLGIDV